MKYTCSVCGKPLRRPVIDVFCGYKCRNKRIEEVKLRLQAEDILSKRHRENKEWEK